MAFFDIIFASINHKKKKMEQKWLVCLFGKN